MPQNYLVRTWLIVIVLISTQACKTSSADSRMSYSSGFQVLRAIDTSRTYKPNASSDDYLRHRLVDIDIWYPAQLAPTDQPLRFHNLLGLLEFRANYYTNTNTATGITNRIAKSLCEGFACSDSARLLSLETNTYDQPTPAIGKFPVILYLASYNGMAYENYQLFERLSSQGFVVVSISSIGRYPGDMTMKKADMMEQVNDAMFALRHLPGKLYLDLTKIGILGYSWGSMAAASLASRIPGISCIVDWDGSTFHHYGANPAEDADFDSIRNGAFHNLKITIPYLRMESTKVDTTQRYKAVYNFLEKVKGPHFVLGIDAAAHEDFSSLPSATRQSGNCTSDSVYQTISTLTISYFEDHLEGKHSFDTQLKKQQHSLHQR
ncbi:hypothetical protein KTO58_03315 [Chitinophaga pendula]|uniref:CocE/NonD family hydrolase n=1 Tax=Chitinophaga TaxID=79328 RepID=UPI000BAF1C15|nr:MULTISPECIES: CocE/NonD family hydrolase [Chitinophaga]ASZ14135.1 hypothetical protein CK934_25890 [Chitinophaga sp. MD30]UCJ08229.1 hypothetical protein KTO58_03315 [Chitinophaga pendula]